MTAVEWLVEQLFSDNAIFGVSKELLEQAKAIEKEQIMQAYKFNATGEPDGAEHYYEMFYKKYQPSTGAPARTEDNTLGIPNRMLALLAFRR